MVLIECPGGALHTCVAKIDRRPSVLNHTYHRHSNQAGPEVGFGGIRQLRLLGGGLAPPPPPPPPPHGKPVHPFAQIWAPRGGRSCRGLANALLT